MDDFFKRREAYCVRLSNQIGLTRNAADMSDVPPRFREWLRSLRLRDIITPLMQFDRTHNNASYGELAIKYRLHKSQVHRYLSEYRPENSNANH